MNPKSGYWPLKRGVDFCGYRIWTTHIRPRRRAIRAWKARFRRMAALYARGRVRLRRCREAVMSFLAVMRHANAAVTTENMLNRFVLRSLPC
jgi:hypothetical protein